MFLCFPPSLQIGLTALHIAAWKGHASMVEMLIRAGCNTLAQSHNGKSALQLAQEEDQHECVTILQAASSKVSISLSFSKCHIKIVPEMFWMILFSFSSKATVPSTCVDIQSVDLLPQFPAF